MIAKFIDFFRIIIIIIIIIISISIIIIIIIIIIIFIIIIITRNTLFESEDRPDFNPKSSVSYSTKPRGIRMNKGGKHNWTPV